MHIKELIHRNRYLISFLVIAVGILVPFIGLGSVVICVDEGYQTLCCRDYLNGPMAMLSFYIGHLWMGWFGDEIMSLRILMVLCYEFSILASCIYLYKKQGDILLASVVFALMSISIRFSTLYIYNWDTGVYPFLTLYAIGLLSYATRRSVKKIILVGIMTALMVLGRIPTLSSLLVTFIVIIFANRVKENGIAWKSVLMDSVAGLFSFAVVALGVILLMTDGSIIRYMEAWNPDNIINGHFDREFISYRIKYTVMLTVAATAPMVIAYAFSAFMYKIKRSRRLLLAITTISLFMISFFMAMIYVVYLSWMIIAGVLEGMFLLIFLTPWGFNIMRSQEDRIPWFRLLTIAGCAVVAMVGSDGFIERMMTINTIPLLIAVVYSRYKRFIGRFLYFSLLVILAFSGYFMIYAMRDPINDYNVIPHLRGIKVNEDNDDVALHEVLSIVDSLRREGQDFAAYGNRRFPIEYIYHDRASYNMNRYHYFDRPEDLKVLNGLTEKYNYIFEVSSKPNVNSQQFLQEKGYDVIVEGEGYVYFERNAEK